MKIKANSIKLRRSIYILLAMPILFTIGNFDIALAQSTNLCVAGGGICQAAPCTLPNIRELPSLNGYCSSGQVCCGLPQTCLPEGTQKQGVLCADLNPGCCPNLGLFCADEEIQTCTDSTFNLVGGLSPSTACPSLKTVKVAVCKKFPEEKVEKEEPVYFKPQITIPGSITIGGKVIEFVKGKGVGITGNTAAQYFAVFYKFFVAALAVMAIVMAMWGGFKRIMAAGSPEKIKGANETIVGALTGIVIGLISYSLLSLVNPALISFKTLTIEPIKKESLEFLTDSQFQAITGKAPLKPMGEEMKGKIRQAASSTGVPYCVFYAIFQHESGGDEKAVGFDENVRKTGVTARRAFVDGYNCVQTHSKTAASSCSITGSAKNDDKKDNINPSVSDLGLDWRYSRGFGVGQITIFPTDSVWQAAGGRKGATCGGVPCIIINGHEYLPKDLFDFDKNIQAMADLWKSDKCPGSTVTRECFVRYNGSGKHAEQYGTSAFAAYEACLETSQ